jgi:hypothetical protein
MPMTPAESKQRLGDVRSVLDGTPQEGETREAQVSRAFAMLKDCDANMCVFVTGQVNPEAAIVACRAGVAQWWEALAGATYFGKLDNLRALRAAMEEDTGKCTTKPNFSATMTWGCWNYAIVEGVPPVMNTAVLEQLFDWGASPAYKDYNGGTYFEKALEGSPAAIINSFIRHGAPAERAEQARDQFINNGNYARARDIQQALGLGGFFTKVDDNTLMETKYIAQTGRTSQLRTVFNFGARRVNEIFETPGASTAMTSCNFDDYDRAALDAARQTLERLGGKPDAAFELAEKPKRLGLGR